MNILNTQYAKILRSIFATSYTPLSSFHTYFLSCLEENQAAQITPDKNGIYAFLHSAAETISSELETLPTKEKKAIETLATKLEKHSFLDIFCAEDLNTRQLLWTVFCSEAAQLALDKSSDVLGDIDQHIHNLRKKRTINITELNLSPITNPAEQILFTSNVLLTIPLTNNIDALNIPEKIKGPLKNIIKEEQLYWYDHPMPIGISKEANEMIYGLKGLEDMLVYEKEQGTVDKNAILQVVLSVSVTHAGLVDIAHEYLQYELEKAGQFKGLEVYIFTEKNTRAIAKELNLLLDNKSKIETVFGVDGRYGRHYSFLKAIAPLWAISKDANIRATFKIDLDQVFPQKELQKETGKTALEHFKTALWGAKAKDSSGNNIELGMIAGALVNESDISKGLFTPDVNFPKEPIDTMDILFPRTLAMAISTRAEMMTGYHGKDGHPNGKNTALHRVHVTGGTNGILIDALRKYQAFTPSFIGRAEDQAFLMSVYNNNDNEAKLRYIHASGLIMRHDKAAFAGEAIKAAKLGTYVGDLLRTVLFSRYAEVLPGGIDAFKKEFAPFTSCFSTTTPFLMLMSRLLLHCLSLDENLVETQLLLAKQSLAKELHTSTRKEWLKNEYLKEKKEWENYYKSLDILESNANPDAPNIHAFNKIATILDSCRL